MTTVAIRQDNGPSEKGNCVITVATDSLITTGDVLGCSGTPKFLVLPPHFLSHTASGQLGLQESDVIFCAFAGTISHVGSLLDALSNREGNLGNYFTPDSTLNLKMFLIGRSFIEKGLKVVTFSNCGLENSEFKVSSTLSYHVAGSGGTMALSAMLAGADPLRAVEIAGMIDCYTGGSCGKADITYRDGRVQVTLCGSNEVITCSTDHRAFSNMALNVPFVLRPSYGSGSRA